MIKIQKKGIQRVVTEEQYEKKFKSLGFEIVEEKTDNATKDLTTKEIKEILEEYNIPFDEKMKKAELVELLKTELLIPKDIEFDSKIKKAELVELIESV